MIVVSTYYKIMTNKHIINVRTWRQYNWKHHYE